MALTQISSDGIKDTTIATADIADDAVTADKLANAINTDIAAKAALTGSTNNTICTVTGANAIQGEANLTFDGDNLIQTINSSGEGIQVTTTGDAYPQISLGANRGTENHTVAWFEGKWNGTSIGGMSVECGDDTTNKDDGKISFYTTASGTQTKKMTIEQDGNVHIDDGDLVIGTAGHGIDFSANSHASGMSSETLDSYEEGSWTPTATAGTFAVASGTYTKIGRLVTAFFVIEVHSTTSGNHMQFNGLPFTNAGNSGENMSSIAYNETGNVMRIYVNGSGVAGLFWNDSTSFFSYANCSGDRIRGGVSYFAST